MISIVDAYYHTKYNPFNLAPLLYNFFDELSGHAGNLIFAQIVIPICTHNELKAKLEKSQFGPQNKSSLWKRFDDKAQFCDLQERLDSFKNLTSQTLQYAMLNEWIHIDEELLSVTTLERPESSSFETTKCAINLAKLIKDLTPIEVYSTLGVLPR